MKRNNALALLGALFMGLSLFSSRVQADSASLPVSHFVGTWENGFGDRYRITADGNVYRDNEEVVYARFPSTTVDRGYDNFYFAQLIEVTAKTINGSGFQYAPSSSFADERLIIAGQGGFLDGGNDSPYPYFRVADTDPPSPWNTQKGQELQKFMDEWSVKMKQKGYEKLYLNEGPLSLEWQGQQLDAVFSHTGESEADYSVVAVYAYDRGNGLQHIYHFAVRPDGSSTIIYSEQLLGRAGSQARGPVYMVSKLSTGNKELLDGFAAIVND